MVWILWGWLVCLFGWNNDDARRFSYLLDPKGFRIFGVLIRKVFVSLDPKGFRIYLSVSLDPKGFRIFRRMPARGCMLCHEVVVHVSHHRVMNPPPTLPHPHPLIIAMLSGALLWACVVPRPVRTAPKAQKRAAHAP
jgi:hypothetical protein